MTKGRPRADADRHLSESLVLATEQSLEAKSHLDLTTREISERAGTHASMINYYFGCKDDLLIEIVDGLIAKADRVFSAMTRDIATEPEPTRRMLRALFDSYYEFSPSITGIIIIEIRRPGSRIKAAFEERRGSRIYERILGLISILIERGIYRRDLDPAAATLAFFSLVTGPATLLPIWSSGAPEMKNFDYEQWFEETVAMLDSFWKK